MTDTEKLAIVKAELLEFHTNFDEDEAIDWAYAAAEMCRKLLEVIDTP